MEYQQLIIGFCFYSLFIILFQQSQLTYAGQHLCARNEAFYLLEFKQSLTVDQTVPHYGCDSHAYSKTLSWNIVANGMVLLAMDLRVNSIFLAAFLVE